MLRRHRTILEDTAILIGSPKLSDTVRSKAATANSLFSAALCSENAKIPDHAGKR
jgi:hypothetical protein